MSSLVEKIQGFLASAPVNVEGIIRLFNIELDRNADLHDAILGEIRKKEDGRYKISVQKKDHYYRKRFTMAHELGHFLLHGNLIGEGVDDNVAYRSVPEGNFYNPKITPREETEANQFAASVLMPEMLLLPRIQGVTEAFTPDFVNTLAREFQVSQQAMRIRIDSLRKNQNDETQRDSAEGRAAHERA